jgi:hypothetical protein
MKWLAASFIILALACTVSSAPPECPKGFEFIPNSGVGCVQTNCFDRGGVWSSTQACICPPGKTMARQPVDYSGFNHTKCGPFCPVYELLACGSGEKKESQGLTVPKIMLEDPAPSPAPSTGPSTLSRMWHNFKNTPNFLRDTYNYLMEVPKGREGEKAGFVKCVKNKQYIRLFKPKSGKWVRVGVHMGLYPGDRIRTGPDSKVKVIIFTPQGTQDVIDIRPNTLFEVPGVREIDMYGKTPRILRVPKGIIKTIIRRIKGEKPSFYIKTPTVVLGVRGTEFIVGHDPDTMRDFVMVVEGEVEVTSQDNKTTLVVKPGEQLEAVDGVLGQIQQLDENRWSELTSDLDDWDETDEDASTPTTLILLLAAGLIPIVAVGVVALAAVAAIIYFIKKRRKKE